jgi:hypothetical protein
VVLVFFKVVHVESRQPFLLAYSYGMVPVALAPLSRGAAGLLEGVGSITHWADSQAWAIVPFSATVEDSGRWLAFDARGGEGS